MRPRPIGRGSNLTALSRYVPNTATYPTFARRTAPGLGRQAVGRATVTLTNDFRAAREMLADLRERLGI